MVCGCMWGMACVWSGCVEYIMWIVCGVWDVYYVYIKCVKCTEFVTRGCVWNVYLGVWSA